MASSAEELHYMVPTFRRDSAEVIGAVRRSSVEFLGMEQMPGGKFQITCRTVSGADAFISRVLTSLTAGQTALEDARRSFGGEEPLLRAEGPAQGPTVVDPLLELMTLAPGPASASESEPVKVERRAPMFQFADVEAPELASSTIKNLAEVNGK